MTDQYKAYLHVREFKTRKCVRCIGLTDISERHVERTMLGLLINADTDNYFIDDSDVDRARKKGNKSKQCVRGKP